MKTGLAIWHYPHRSMLENARFFIQQGYESISLLGTHMVRVCRSAEDSCALAEAVAASGVTLTVHHCLPKTHGTEDVAEFHKGLEAIAAWQKAWGLMAVYSFDVQPGIRDNIAPYLHEVLETVPGCKVAVEDFGLTAAEYAQIEHLKAEPRFGYLLDIGHMFIRLRGRNGSGYPLFTHTDIEGPVCDNPGSASFLDAFRSKEFPVFEIHMHNNDGVEDMHYFLEDGALDVPAVAKAIKVFGFDGVLTIESAPGFHFPCCYPESDERILRTTAYWHDIMKNA